MSCILIKEVNQTVDLTCIFCIKCLHIFFLFNLNMLNWLVNKIKNIIYTIEVIKIIYVYLFMYEYIYLWKYVSLAFLPPVIYSHVSLQSISLRCKYICHKYECIFSNQNILKLNFYFLFSPNIFLLLSLLLFLVIRRLGL